MPQIWESALSLPPLSSEDERLFDSLCGSVEAQPMLVDLLVAVDVQRLADSEDFFVFEELLRAVLLAFSRDSSVPKK